MPCLRRVFNWNFVVADTTHPLIGIDFLSNFGLFIDCANRSIKDSSTKLSSQISLSSVVHNIVTENYENVSSEVHGILKKFPDVTSPNSRSSKKVETVVYHRIDTGNSTPIFTKPRLMSTHKLEVAKEEFRKLQKAGIIQPSMSPWSSPLHMVKKNETSYRPCGDYRCLNMVSKPDRYPIPNINSLSFKLSEKCVFSKLDLVNAYHQIPIHPEDIPKTAVVTNFGLWEYKFMPFGLRNSSSTFQRYMDVIFRNVPDVFIYLDDILVASENMEQHLKDLESVFEVLCKNNLKISLKKCVFAVDNLDFLGCNISKKGMKPTSSKTDEISEFPCPNDSRSLRQFLGMVGFYRKLIPHFTSLTYPLSERIRMEPKSKSLQLSEEEKSSFANVKKVLADLSPLPHPDEKVTHYQMVCDASNFGIGAALHQMIDDEPVPIGFFSKKLSQTQSRYSAFDRELLAVYYSTLHFRHYIDGRNVLVLSDHKPLVNAFKSKNCPKSDRQQRHLSIISEYITDMAHIKGSENIVADCLSRPAMSVTLDLSDLPEIAREQSSDGEILQYQDNLKCYPITDVTNVLCDTSTSYPRPFVPSTLRRKIFDSLHCLSHPGVRASVKLIKNRFYWPNIDKDIREWCRLCESCQQSKIQKHTRSAIMSFDIPSERFNTVHIDIVGPLKPISNIDNNSISPYRYLLTCIDRTTRWIEACPLTDITASSVCHAFMNCWISRFGVPLHVVTDRGSQFESELFQELSKLVGFHRLRTTSYHPQANGLVERMHRSLKTSIMARKENWLISLPIVLMSLRAIPNESEFSPFTAVTGAQMLLSQPIVNPDFNDQEFSTAEIRKLSVEMSKINTDMMSKGRSHGSKPVHVPKELESCTCVWLRIDRVRKPLEAPYTGPHKVIKRFPKCYVIDINGKDSTVSIDRLKPAFITDKPPQNREVIEEITPEPVIPQPKEVVTRAGRRVKFRINLSIVH